MFIFILLFISIITVVIVLEINMNYIDIFCSSWMYDTGMNTYITCILNRYTKDRNVDLGDYIVAGEKPVKVNLYKMFIIIVDILNNLDTIILVDIAYCFIFFANVVLVKCFWFKEIYLDKKHSQLHKKKII